MHGAWGSGCNVHDTCYSGYSAVVSSASSGGRILGHPFRCCVMPDFVVPVGENDLQQLQEELLKLKFHPKSNDLYQFSQVCVWGGGGGAWGGGGGGGGLKDLGWEGLEWPSGEKDML